MAIFADARRWRRRIVIVDGSRELATDSPFQRRLLPIAGSFSVAWSVWNVHEPCVPWHLLDVMLLVVESRRFSRSSAVDVTVPILMRDRGRAGRRGLRTSQACWLTGLQSADCIIERRF